MQASGMRFRRGLGAFIRILAAFIEVAFI